jgi:hypothetical protein
VARSGDRRRAYVNAADGSAAALIDVDTGHPVGSLSPVPIDPEAAAPAVDLDRQAVFTTTAIAGLLQRHDLQTGTATHTSPFAAPQTSFAIAVSGDGRVLADELERDPYGGIHVGVELRDPQTLAVRRRLPPLGLTPWYLWLNHDGSLLAATEATGNRVELWDTRTARRRWQTDIGYRAGSAIAITPNGATMVVGTFEGGVALLDVATGRVLARHTERLSYRIASVQFAPDGTIVALGGNDGRAHLLAADTLHEIGQLPLAAGAAWAFVSYNADGTRLSAVDERGRVMHWDTRPESWIRHACTIAGRDFTSAEWTSYLPGVPHRHTCTSS